ncbi:hypothetical protein SBV1_1570028 [Verrucomicrobia bacterium]|nr:hypothetical protein SBV1_1570028 [Verrucomicrobiota bacterium]
MKISRAVLRAAGGCLRCSLVTDFYRICALVAPRQHLYSKKRLLDIALALKPRIALVWVLLPASLFSPFWAFCPGRRSFLAP